MREKGYKKQGSSKLVKQKRKPERIRIGAKRARIVGVFACKGGVGKTTTAVNLASYLNEEIGSDVVLVEANLTAPSVGMHLGIIDSPITCTTFWRIAYSHPRSPSDQISPFNNDYPKRYSSPD